MAAGPARDGGFRSDPAPSRRAFDPFRSGWPAGPAGGASRGGTLHSAAASTQPPQAGPPSLRPALLQARRAASRGHGWMVLAWC